MPTKSHVDSAHENNRNRRDLLSVFNDQDIEFDENKKTNLDSIKEILVQIMNSERKSMLRTQ